MPADQGYGPDLAYIHDVGFSGFAVESAPAILQMLRSAGITSGLVTDLGCGSGVWAQILCGAGYQVLGVDISSAMIKLARKHAPQAKFLRASLWGVQLPRCEAVTALGECLNYTFDPTSAARALHRLFRRVYAALRPGGLLVFDLAGPGVAQGRGTERGFWEGRGWTVLVEKSEDGKRRLLTRRIVTYRRVGARYRRSGEVHRLKLHPRDEVAEALRQAGFAVRVMRAYGGFRLPGTHAAFLARKPLRSR